MTNEELIERFESETLPGEFHHAEHVRLAFAYLSECPVVEALDRFVNALKRFAKLRGKPERYHETITFAYFFLIHERMARTPDLEWDEFARRNADCWIGIRGFLVDIIARRRSNPIWRGEFLCFRIIASRRTERPQRLKPRFIMMLFGTAEQGAEKVREPANYDHWG